MRLTAEVDVTFDEADLARLTDREAVARAAIPAALEVIRDVWVRAVSGELLPGMARAVNDADYAAALRDPAAIVYPDDGNALEGAVVVPPGDAYGRAVVLEKGRKPRDMKPGLLAGPKARTGKRGRYNVIPLKPKGEDDLVFRTVSDRSPRESWVYPGMPSAGVVDAVATASERPVEDAVREAVRKFYEG